MAETIYTINLGKVWRKPRNKRMKASIDFIRYYITRHLKAQDVKVSAELNNLIFSGIPRKVKVKTKKEGEVVFVTTSTAKFVEKKPLKAVEKKEEKKPEEEEEKKTPEQIELEKKEKEAREVQDKAAVLEG
jgi:large subunit ribosomal protein L31e